MSQYVNPQRRRYGQPSMQTSSKGRYNNQLEYSDSDRTGYTEYTPYSRGSNYPQQRGKNSNQLDYSDSDRTGYTDYTPYSREINYPQQRGRNSNQLDYSDSDRTGYTDYTPYSRGSNYPQQRGRNNNQLDYSDSDRTGYTGYTDYTPYSRGTNYYGDDQYYYESDNLSYQSRGNHGSFNSGIGAQQQRRGSFDSRYSDVQSYEGDNMSQPSTYCSRQSNQRAQYDNASICGSTSATTVADGGRGRCPYQIGFHVQNTGKQMSTTKRIIQFRFGFANPEALASGLAGVDCRGQEHDLTITWSITGGKRMISIDGREIQYTAGKRANPSKRADILEAAWRMADHIFELKCYAYVPKAGSPEKRNRKWKQYNLIIDGRSFFELPEIFDLGLRGLTGRLPHTISGGSDSDQMSVTSSTQSVSSGASSSQYTNQASVKSSIQSRIEEQRRLMNRKKQEPTTVKKSRPKNPNASMASDSSSDLTSSNLMSFTSLNVSEQNDVFSSGVYSSEPSELSEMRNRQTTDDEQTEETTEHRQQSTLTSESVSALVPQQQAQQPQKLYQPLTSPATSELSPSVVSSQVQNQHPSKLSNVQSQEISNQITLVPQQPPTYEEITQALVPSPFVRPQNDGQGHYQQQNSSVRHQPKALPPSSSKLPALPEQHPVVTSSHNQSQYTNGSQRSAQPAGSSSHHRSKPAGSNQRNIQGSGGSSHYQPQPTNNKDPTISPQEKTQPTNNRPKNTRGQPIKTHKDLPRKQIPGNLPKGANKFAFF